MVLMLISALDGYAGKGVRKWCCCMQRTLWNCDGWWGVMGVTKYNLGSIDHSILYNAHQLECRVINSAIILTPEQIQQE